MKKIILLVLFFLSCNVKPKKEEPCIKKMEYISQLKMLVPEAALNVYIEDKDGSLKGKVNSKELKSVIFYTIKQEDREYFRLYEPNLIASNTDKNIFILKMVTAYFYPKVYIHGVIKEKKWTPEQIQKAIEGDIGFVFEKDTIIVKMCKN